MTKFKLGLVSVSFRGHSFEEIIEAAKKADLRFIEWGSDVHAPFNDTEKLYKIANLQKENKLECSSYGTYFELGVDCVSDLEEYIAAAKILNTNVLRVWCGNKSPWKYSPIEKETLFSECKAAAEIAEKHNVILCMECHQNTYTENKESALELMKEISSENFRMYWQPNQFRTEEENIEYLELLLPYVFYIHVFNWKKDKKYPLMLAEREWKNYLSRLKGKHTLLLEFMPDDKIESLQNEGHTLRNIAEVFI